MTKRKPAIKIIKRLRREGYEALLAGGCVRDMLLGRAAHDYDVATNARPAEVIKLFKRTLKVGAKFGVVIVLLDGKQVEVATFRTERDYADGRHPGKVRFTDAAEDAARRDFTINAVFYDPIEKNVIDYVNGRADLRRGIIRTVGEPDQRFGEDFLRMLRAVRFSTKLGFALERQTKAAICKNAGQITNVSGERIAIELEGILVSPHRAAGLALLLETGLAEAIFPGLGGRCAEQGLAVTGRLRQKVDFALVLASVFAGCESDFALEKCRVLKLSRSRTKHIRFLLASRGKLLNENMSVAELKLILAEPYFWDLYELQRAIQRATDGAIGPLIKLRRRIKALGDVELKPKPLLDGHDLIRLGAVPGPAFGQLAEEIYIAQLEGTLQDRRQAEKWAKNWLDRHRGI